MPAVLDSFEGRRKDTHIGYIMAGESLLRVLGEEMGNKHIWG